MLSTELSFWRTLGRNDARQGRPSAFVLRSSPRGGSRIIALNRPPSHWHDRDEQRAGAAYLAGYDSHGAMHP